MLAVTIGDELTFTDVVVVAEQPPAPVTVTVYTPDIAVVADDIVGFCSVDAKVLGPLHM